MFSVKKFMKIFKFNKKTEVLINYPDYKMNSVEEMFFEYLSNGDTIYCEKMFDEGFQVSPEFREILEFETRILFETSLLGVKNPHPIVNFTDLNFLRFQNYKNLNKKYLSVWNTSSLKNAGTFLIFLLSKGVYSKNMLSLLGKDVSTFIAKDNKILNSENKDKIIGISSKYKNSTIGIINRGTENFLFYGVLNNIFLIGFEKPSLSDNPSKDFINFIHKFKKKKEIDEPQSITNLKNNSYLYHLNITDLDIPKTLLNKEFVFNDTVLHKKINDEVCLEFNKKRQRDIAALFFVKDLIHSLINKNEISHAQIFEENINNRPGLRGLALFALLDNFKEVAPLVTEEKLIKLSNIPLHNNFFDIAYKELIEFKKQNKLINIKQEIQKNNLSLNSDFSILSILENIDIPLEIKNKVEDIVNQLNSNTIKNIKDYEVISTIENIKIKIEDMIINYSSINQLVEDKNINNQILDFLSKSEQEIEKINKMLVGSTIKNLELENKIFKKYTL